jgi:hypothetical protein
VYLSKVKWDDIVERRAMDKAQRGRKLGLEVERGRREAEHFLGQVDKQKVVAQIRARRGDVGAKGGTEGFAFSQRGVANDNAAANRNLARTLLS